MTEKEIAEIQAVANMQTDEDVDFAALLGDVSHAWDDARAQIEYNMSHRPRSLQTSIGCSEIGTDCLHCLAAKLARFPKYGGGAWLPFIGTCVHAGFEKMFGNVPETIEDGRKRYATEMPVHVDTLRDGTPLNGSIDLLDRKAHETMDWKIVGTARLKDVSAHGPSQTYVVQQSLYGIGARNAGEQIDRMTIAYLGRNITSLRDATIITMDADPAPGIWAKLRADNMLYIIENIRKYNGEDVLRAWIASLPSSEHCFNCNPIDVADRNRINNAKKAALTVPVPDDLTAITRSLVAKIPASYMEQATRRTKN